MQFFLLGILLFLFFLLWIKPRAEKIEGGWLLFYTNLQQERKEIYIKFKQ